jgi:hypothetical protein
VIAAGHYGGLESSYATAQRFPELAGCGPEIVTKLARWFRQQERAYQTEVLRRVAQLTDDRAPVQGVVITTVGKEHKRPVAWRQHATVWNSRATR